MLHAFAVADPDSLPYVTHLYAQFLMVDDLQVSFAAKQALTRALRPKVKKRHVHIPTPPPCTSPPTVQQPPPSGGGRSQEQQEQQQQLAEAEQEELQFHDAVPMQQGKICNFLK